MVDWNSCFKNHFLIFGYQMSTLKRCLRFLFSFIEGGKMEKSSGSNAVAVSVPVVLLLLLMPAVAVLLYRRFAYFKTKY